MAYVQAQALIHRLKEVLEDSAGSVRTVPVGRFQGDWPQGLSDPTQARLTFANPRVRVNLDALTRSQYSPPINSNIIIYDVDVSIIVARLLDREKQLVSDDYDTVQAAAIEDTDIIRQALEWPENLTTATVGGATDVVSGMLAFVGPSTNQIVGLIDQGAQRLETTNRFSGYIIARASGGSALPPTPVIALGTTFSIGNTITWSAVPGATSYRLLRDGVDVGAAMSPYTILAADVGPEITVKARNAEGDSSASNVLQFVPITANIKGDYDSYDPSHYVNGSGLATTALDQSGAGNDITSAAPPAISAAGGPDGAHDAFDFTAAGSAKGLGKSAMGLGVPCTIYEVMQRPGNLRFAHDGGNAVDTRALYGVDATHTGMYAGLAMGSIAGVAGTWVIDTTIYNGANSKHYENGGTAVTGDSGASTDAGLVWGGRFGLASANGLNAKACRLIVYAAAHTDAQVQDMVAYLTWWKNGGGRPQLLLPSQVSDSAFATANVAFPAVSPYAAWEGPSTLRAGDVITVISYTSYDSANAAATSVGVQENGGAITSLALGEVSGTDGVFFRRASPYTIQSDNPTLRLIGGIQTVRGLGVAGVNFGTYLSAVALPAGRTFSPMTQTTTRRLVAVVDSIGCGQVSTDYVLVGLAAYLRANYPGRVTFVGGGAAGLASLVDDYGSEAAAGTAVAALLNGSVTNELLSEIGTNDLVLYAAQYANTAAYRAAMAAFWTALKAAKPSAAVFLQTIMDRTSLGGALDTVANWRTAQLGAASDASLTVTALAGATVVSLTGSADGVHPTAAKQALYGPDERAAMGTW